jgi:uncharacterized protein (DUF58 family)
VNATPGTQRHAAAPPLAYALRWRVAGLIPGSHLGSDSGQSGRFHQTVPFDRNPDPRRIDLRAITRDPFERLWVRQFEQRAAVRVEMLIDTSASMRYGARSSNWSLTLELVSAVASAVHKNLDLFGLAACGQTVEFSQPARRGDPQALVARLAALRPRASGVRGLFRAAEQLAGRRKLVFLVSDFSMPIETLGALFDALSSHDVIPVQFAEAVEQALPIWGLAELLDLEDGKRRLIVLRPTLRARWRRQAAERQTSIAQLCLARGRRLCVFQGTFDELAFAEYLLTS